MRTSYILLLTINISTVVALLPAQWNHNETNMENGKENTARICDLQPYNGGPYLEPWQEIPQHTQGCWVPYFGPQGHGHLPEEVHIVHITDIDRVLETLSHPNQVTITINLQLTNAMCQNRTNDELEPEQDKTSSEFHNINRKIGASSLVPPILPLRDIPNGRLSNPLPYSSRQTSTSNKNLYNLQRPLVLLLTSDRPVTWQIIKSTCWNKELISKVQAIVEKESSVVSNTSLEILSKTWVKRITRRSIQRYARRTFHGVASFTQVKGANSIKISVGPHGSPDEILHHVSVRNKNKLNYCDFNSREDSEVVTASILVPLAFEHCVLGNSNITKLFIIEIQQSLLLTVGGNGKLETPNVPGLGAPSTGLPHIIVHFTNDIKGTRDMNNLGPQNVTIFLKSNQPTQWVVSSSVQYTNLNVVTSSTDIINSVKSMQISQREFPLSGSDLLHEVLTETDTQVLYFRVEHLTVLTLNIDGSMDEAIPELADPRKKHASVKGFPPALLNEDMTFDLPTDFNGRKKNILTLLESEMTIVCGKSMLEIFLPAPTLEQMGVKRISLLDKSCQSKSNGTHFILSSLLKDCGSDIQTTDGRASLISNKVVVDITLPDSKIEHVTAPFSKSENSKLIQLEVPIACGWNEDYVRSIFNSRDISSEEDEDMGNLSPSSHSSSIYQLELYYKDSFTKKLAPIKSRKFVEVYDRIYVRAWMDDAPSAQAVMESCWINNVPYSSPWQPQQKNVLLSGMCPIEKSVNLEQQSFAPFISKTKSNLFSFQVLKEYAFFGQELYVHCQIGVCLSNLKFSKGKPVICVDPYDYCLHQKSLQPSSKLSSTAHQVLTRGPILLPPVSDAFTPFSTDTKCAGVTVFPYSSSISLHMTVTIAICSFIIGIGLTASLWLIHHKTEPKQRGYHSREHSLGSQTAVLGSSLSPHSACSSTNSQSAITS